MVAVDVVEDACLAVTLITSIFFEIGIIAKTLSKFWPEVEEVAALVWVAWCCNTCAGSTLVFEAGFFA